MLRLSMRVLTVGNMYPPHHLGGYELVWKGAVDHMRAEGHDARVLTTTVRLRDDGPGDPPHVHRSLPWYWADHGFPPVGWREAMALERAAVRELDEHLAAGVDVVLLWSMGGMPMELCSRPESARIPVGAVVHDAWPEYGPRVDGRRGRGGTRLRAAVERLRGLSTGDALRAIDAWSFNSAWLMTALRDRVPAIASAVPAARRVDHPGVDLQRLAPAPEREWEGRLAVVGRLDERKGVRHVVDALPSLPEVTLVVTGSGDAEVAADLRALAARRGVAGRVRFVDARDDVREAYAEADVVVFPVTWDEPFGLVPLEAMAVGRPVVATATGGAAEYLRDGVNALIVEPGDPDAIAGAVRRLAEEPDLRRRLVRDGSRTAQARPAAGFDAAMESFATDVAQRVGAISR